MLINDQVYKRFSDGILAKCIDEEFGRKVLDEVHSKICGLDGPTLARRIQRLGYFWPELRKQANELQRNCKQCQLVIDPKESFFVEEEDWRRIYIDYINHGQLPDDTSSAILVKCKADRFFV